MSLGEAAGEAPDPWSPPPLRSGGCWKSAWPSSPRRRPRRRRRSRASTSCDSNTRPRSQTWRVSARHAVGCARAEGASGLLRAGLAVTSVKCGKAAGRRAPSARGLLHPRPYSRRLPGGLAAPTRSTRLSRPLAAGFPSERSQRGAGRAPQRRGERPEPGVWLGSAETGPQTREPAGRRWRPLVGEA